MIKPFLLDAGYIPSPAKGHPISKWESPHSGSGVREVSSPAKTNTSSCLSLNRDGQGARTRATAPTLLGMPSSPCMIAAPWQEQGLPAWPCTQGSSFPGNDCPIQGLLPSSHALSDLGFSFTPTSTCRGKERQDRGKALKRNNFFWGKKSLFLGLHQKEPLFTPPTGTGCWVPLVRQNFPQLC